VGGNLGKLLDLSLSPDNGGPKPGIVPLPEYRKGTSLGYRLICTGNSEPHRLVAPPHSSDSELILINVWNIRDDYS
jgi:hypothetical protein